jgi:MvdC family ATP-grasp ribosomal peptide maturase
MINKGKIGKDDFVLLVTHSGDFFTVDRVSEAIIQLGATPFRLDTDKFPITVSLNAHFDNRASYYSLSDGDRSISTNQVKAVWMRRIWEPQMSPDLSPQYESACITQSFTFLNNFWDSLKHPRWVDNLARITTAENKLLQLRLASELGLTIPKTLVTNNPEEVKQFFNQGAGKIVTKLLTPLSFGMKGSSLSFYTTEVKEEDLADAETLRYCPMIFQQQIPKSRELRVVFVNGKFFVGALDASLYSDYSQDWRCTSTGEWLPETLPDEVANRLHQFMFKLGLFFGVFDLIQTPLGGYVFLELNPTGEWGMLEKDLGYPISMTIANTLLNKNLEI